MLFAPPKKSTFMHIQVDNCWIETKGWVYVRTVGDDIHYKIDITSKKAQEKDVISLKKIIIRRNILPFE